jgi:hypothetical protein
MDVISIIEGLLEDSNRLWRFVRDWRKNEERLLPFAAVSKNPGYGRKRDTESELRYAYLMCFVEHCIQLLPYTDRQYWKYLRRGYSHEKARHKAYGYREEKSDIARRLLVKLRQEWENAEVQENEVVAVR